MLTGLFLDLRNPEPWRRPAADHYRRTLERVAIAEGLGLDAVWLTEHHFFDDGYLPQPLVLAAALAVRTTRVRIGTGIVIAPLRHPVHLAEEAALVDLLSDGRLELGLGAGWARQEFATFGADHAGRFSATDAALEEVRRLLSPGGVTPGPVQQPVPLWMGYQRPGGARRAGRLGAGLLSLDRTLLEPYLDGLAAGGHDPASAQMGGLFDAVLADDPDAARELLRPHHAHQVATYRQARGLAPVDADTLPGPRVLTPDAMVDAVRAATAGLPVQHVYVWDSVAGMPEDLATRHVELLCTQVQPALAAL